MASEGRDRSNRWLQSPVWWIGSVAILGLVVVGVFGIRSLTVSNEGTAPTAPAKERAAVEDAESPVNGADGASAGDRSDEETSDLLAHPEEPTESSNSASPEPEVVDEQPTADIDTGDGEVQRSLEPEVVDEQPDQVITTAEPSDVVLIDEEKDAEFEIEVSSPSGGTGWIVPWGDEVLEIGWPKIGEDVYDNSTYDETNLVARVLSDSDACQNIRPISKTPDYPECWGDLSRYLISNTDGHISAIISDGHRLIVASEDGEQVYVSITNDLNNWDTTAFELPHPSGLPDFAYASSYVELLAMNPNGWLAKITTQISVDVLSLAGVREPDIGIRSVYELDRDLTIQGAWSLKGLTARWWLDDAHTYYRKQFFPWERLGISQEQFCDYSHYCNMKGSVHSSNMSGSVWTATWGNDPIRVELPMGLGYSEKCCVIVGTDAGYMAFSDPGESGYDPTWFGPTNIFYSSDGVEWTIIDSPYQVFSDVWTLGSRLVVAGLPVKGDDEPAGSNWGTVYWWLANSDGSNWREIEETSELKSTFFPYPIFAFPTIWLATDRVVEPLNFERLRE